MAENFKDLPEAIENTAKIAERCVTELKLGTVILPDFPKPDGKTANDYIRKLSHERMVNRFPKEKQTEEVLKRLEYGHGELGEEPRNCGRPGKRFRGRKPCVLYFGDYRHRSASVRTAVRAVFKPR